ncbi:hypothetical protein NC653_011393 [Populus alba x Populus x berolinensis]|uniref:Glutaredoxin domain-containing protein n=1 Tax=Populus alba x Populus x berolinensis TaxID=444605 RepID=A0AAD6W6V2_9ROSI|nr:hypothetical protein NC653_011393 [Populus alba x Populus x berolinensis]
MGCASSKQKRCKHCQTPYSPVPRSYSMHVVHPPQQKGDSYHVVALTSTTLGTLALDSANQNQNGTVDVADSKELNSKEEFSMGLIETEPWSSMIQEKIPKVVPRTPIMTSPGEPETINTWELMAGLEDMMTPHLSHRFRSFSFDVSRDPKVSPTHSFYIKPIDSEKRPHFARDDSSLLVNDVVKACCHVRLILKSLGVRVDERDVSMHSGGGGLPRVFIGRKYVGGAEEIRRMHEERQLEKLVEGCEMLGDGGGTCSGSCKIYYEGDDEEQEELEEGEETGEYGFQRCPDCNENGLIRCPICCD